MKKIRNLVLILALFLCFNGCEKNPVEEDSVQNNVELTVAQAKAFVEMQRIGEFTLKSGKLQKQSIKIKADWTKAKSSNNNKVSVVETEILAMGRFGFATSESMAAWNSSNNEDYLHSVSRLVVIRMKKTGEIYSFIMSVVGDKLYFESKKFKLSDNNYLKRDKDLTGFVLFHDLSGKFVNGWIYCDGQITSSIVQPENLDLPIDLKSALMMQAIYGWIRVCPGEQYNYVSDGEAYVVAQNCYSVLVILGYFETGIGDGGPIIGGGGTSSGGGGTPGGYSPPATCNCSDKCPVCGKCLNNITIKSATLPDGTTTTTTTTDPCVYCTCPPSNPIPSISSLSSPFGVVAKMTARDVYYLIGGNVLLNYQSNPTTFSNACALRLSYALNSILGSEIPFVEGKTLSGDVNRDGIKEWYFYRVSDMVNYLNNTFGACTLTDTNHIAGMTGIIWQSDCGWDDASGHIDIWSSNNALGHYYDRCSVVYIWRN